MSMQLSELDADGAAPDTAGVLDAEAIARLRDLDPNGASGLVGRVLHAFETSAGRLLPQLRAAQQSGDTAGVRFVAHTLKSSSASIGAVRFSALCAELENGIRLQQPIDLAAKVGAVERELQCVLAALAQLPDARR